jgi:hypothetical protein
MNSAMDISVDALQVPGAAARTVLPPKPAGGKAQNCTITLLDRLGFHDLADQAHAGQTAVSAHDQVGVARDRLSAALQQFVAGVADAAAAHAIAPAPMTKARALAGPLTGSQRRSLSPTRQPPTQALV